MRFRTCLDLSAYFVVDPSLCGGRNLLSVVDAALRGGVTMVQLRNKADRLHIIEAQAREILVLTRAAGVPLLINDYVDVAFNVGADGVHLGQGDTPAAQARDILGRDTIIGITAFTPAHMDAIDPAVIDYVGTGPVYLTQTDKGKPVLGPENFSTLAALSTVPVVGIGGITDGNAGEVIRAGAAGVAVMRSISSAADPAQAARSILSAVKAVRLKEAV